MNKKNLPYIIGAALIVYLIIKNKKGVNSINGNLREVEIFFLNGDTIKTSMAAHLSDEEIKAYYRIGKVFNLGSGGRDNMQPIVKVEIIK